MAIPETFTPCAVDCDLPHEHWSHAEVEEFAQGYQFTAHGMATTADCCITHATGALMNVVISMRTLATMDTPESELAAAWCAVVDPLINALPMVPTEVDLGMALDAILQGDLVAFRMLWSRR